MLRPPTRAAACAPGRWSWWSTDSPPRWEGSQAAGGGVGSALHQLCRRSSEPAARCSPGRPPLPRGLQPPPPHTPTSHAVHPRTRSNPPRCWPCSSSGPGSTPSAAWTCAPSPRAWAARSGTAWPARCAGRGRVGKRRHGRPSAGRRLVSGGFGAARGASEAPDGGRHPPASRPPALTLPALSRPGSCAPPQVLLLMEMLRAEPWCYYPLTLQARRVAACGGCAHAHTSLGRGWPCMQPRKSGNAHQPPAAWPAPPTPPQRRAPAAPPPAVLVEHPLGAARQVRAAAAAHAGVRGAPGGEQAWAGPSPPPPLLHAGVRAGLECGC